MILRISKKAPLDQQETFERLFKLYKEGKCTPEEFDQLIELFNNRENEEYARAFLNDFLQSENDAGINSMPGNPIILQQVLEKIKEQDRNQDDRNKGVVIFFKNRLFLGVAAVLLLVFMLTAVYIMEKPSAGYHSPIGQKSSKQLPDIAPGKDGAILTLSNGQKIVLDTAENGQLKHEGEIAISKQGGKVVFQGTENVMSATDIGLNTLSTPYGRQYNLVLADGSKVWLNAGSSITFPTFFTGKERKVEITGEVYFEVAHDQSKPFKVMANEVEVQVLGTHFNVNTYDNEEVKKVTLLEGSVKLTKILNGGTALLQPGQQAQITSRIKIVDNVNVEEVMAWKNGLFVFNNSDIKDIMRVASRWYDMDVIFEGPVSTEKYNGEVSRSTSLREMLKILELAGIKYRIEGRTLTIYQ